MLHLASRDTSRGLAAPREPRWGGPCTSRGRTAPCQNRGEVCVHVKVVLLLVSIDGGGPYLEVVIYLFSRDWEVQVHLEIVLDLFSRDGEVHVHLEVVLYLFSRDGEVYVHVRVVLHLA